MSVCSGIKADGGRCKAQATRNSEWCIGHDPDQAEARRRRASKGGRRGGRGRPQAELAEVKSILHGLADSVLKGTTDRQDAAVVGQLLNTLIRAVSVEVKLKEQLELVERLERLEEGLKQDKEGGSRWRA